MYRVRNISILSNFIYKSMDDVIVGYGYGYGGSGERTVKLSK
jgi:hypothetical protein